MPSMSVMFISVLSSMSMGVSESVTGISRTDKGRFPRAFLRGLGDAANFTGEGDREGSFSLDAVAMFSVSFSSSDSSVLAVLLVVALFLLLAVLFRTTFFFIVNDDILVPDLVVLTGRRSDSSCSGMIVPASSPLSFACMAAFFSSAGIGAWMDVISLA